MSEAQIKQMVDRFLGWKLPDDFNPDGGISFKKKYNEGTKYEGSYNPTGTNLFTATQAELMIRYITEDINHEITNLKTWKESMISIHSAADNRLRPLLKDVPGSLGRNIYEVAADEIKRLRVNHNPACKFCDAPHS